MKHHQLLRRGLSVLLSLVMCLTLVPVTALAATGVTIDKTNFPDQVFREYVSKNCDTNGDGTLSTEEIAAVTSITFFNNTGAELADLTGIEHFTNLGSLCYDSSNLTTLDVSKNTALVRLECYNSKLTTLNLGENTALKSLWCNGNNLTTLDVSKNTALEKLYCNNNNLTTLDVSKNTGLSYLFCVSNNLTKLDVSKNTKLEALHCSKNNLTSMDVSKTVVDTLGCEGNTYTIMLSPQNRTFNLSNLSGFDVSKASGWSGGSVSRNTLKVNEGINEVTYTYNCGKGNNNKDDISCSFALKFIEQPTELTVTTQPDKTAYTHGDVFDPAGMVVKATFADGTTVDNFTDYTIEYENGGSCMVKDNTKVTLKVGTVSVDVTDLTVGVRDVTIIGVTAASRTYESGNKTVGLSGGTVSGVIPGDTVSVDLSSAEGTIEDENAGSYKDVTVTGTAITGKDADKYRLIAQPTGVTVNIEKANYPGSITANKNVRTNTAQTVDVNMFYKFGDIKGAAVKSAKEGTDKNNIISNVSLNGNIVTFDVAKVKDAGKTANINVVISSTNFKDITAVLNVTTVDKADAGVAIFGVPAKDKTYGDPDFTLTGTVTDAAINGTWTWESSDPAVLQVTGSGDKATVKILKAGSATVTAMYESDTFIGQFTTADICVNKVTITFDGNGGTLSGSQTAQIGEDGKLGSLPIPSRDGYTFDGWYTAQTGGEKVTDSTVYTKNTTLYAHWTNNGGNGSSNNNGGNGSSGNNGGNGTSDDITKPECTHGTTEIRGAVVATCTEKGYTGDTYCKDCGEKVATGQDIEALGHDMTKIISDKVDATCTTAGKEAVKGCSRCNHTEGGEEIPALGHDFADTFTVDKEATCTEAGSRSKHCSHCDGVTEVTEIPKKDHTWDSGKVTKEATCTEKGVKTFTCDACHETKTEEIPVLGHTYTSKVTKEATTTDTGIMTYTCSKCGHEYTEVIPKLPGTDPEKDQNLTDQKNPNAAPVAPVRHAKGKKLTDKKNKAVFTVTKAGKVTKSASTGKVTVVAGEVAYTKSTNTGATTLTIPSTVKIDGITYKVTSIGAKAFANNKKLTKVTIGSNVKTIGSKAFTGIYAKATVKVPKTKYKAYKKLLKAKGLGAKASVKK